MSNDIGAENESNVERSDDDGNPFEHRSLETVTSATTSKRKRKRTSVVWKAFIRIPKEKTSDERQRAKCKACGKVYLADSNINGTSSLKRHLKQCLKHQSKDVSQMPMESSDGNLTIRDRKIEANVVRNKITTLILRRELPLAIVEYEEFRDLITYLYPQFHPIGRNTLMAKILRWYTKECKRIKDFLKSFNGRVSLTVDLWSSITTDSYISLTCHYIDIDWVLHKKLLRFCIMPPPHTGAHICYIASKMLLDWSIEKKLFSITLDNVGANLCFIEFLKDNLVLKNVLLCGGKFFHNQCCAHVLKLIVQDGLKCIDQSVKLVRLSIAYVKASQTRKVKFLEICQQLGISTKRGLHGDVTTRWNSTYHMLDSAFFYRRAFQNLQLMDSNYKDCLDLEQWSRVEKLIRFFRPFNRMASFLSRSKYPTANLYFHSVWKIHNSLLEEISHGDSFMGKMAEEMKKKFDQYWDSYSLILAIAMVFDPRCKLVFVEWAFGKISDMDPKAHETFERVKTSLEQLFAEYQSMEVTNVEGASHIDGIDTNMIGDPNDWEEFNKYESTMNSRRDKSQLDYYLEELRIPFSEDFDVLAYWKIRGAEYPVVARMARDVLAIPVSTIASESAFSIGGRVIDKYQSKLLPKNAEALICLQNWMFGVDFRAEPADDVNEMADALQDVLVIKEKEITDTPTLGSCSIASNVVHV